MPRIVSLGLICILLLTAAACGSDDSDDEPTVDSAESCEELVDAVMPIIQDMLDAASELSMTDIMAEDPPDILGDFEASMEEAGAKSEELECQDDEMGRLLNERVDELEASGPVGELLLEGLKQEGFD